MNGSAIYPRNPHHQIKGFVGGLLVSVAIWAGVATAIVAAAQ